MFTFAFRLKTTDSKSCFLCLLQEVNMMSGMLALKVRQLISPNGLLKVNSFLSSVLSQWEWNDYENKTTQNRVKLASPI